MFNVAGLVMVKETQIAIPNLQVVLYDLDRYSMPTATRSLSETNPQAVQSMWQQFQGDRLGSVLTDARGAFEFEFDIKDFKSPGREKKPDLLIFVLAPEDAVIDRSGLPRSLPAQERILYYSHELVLNSGKQESYIIRLSQERLDQFQIPYLSPPSQSAAQTKDAIVADLKESAEMRADLKEAFTEQIRENAKPAIALKKRTDEAFKNFTLSTVPEELRSQFVYLNPGDDLQALQTQLVNDALVKNPEADQATGVQRKLKLSLTEVQVQNLDLDLAPDGTVRGEVDTQKVLGQVKKLANPSQLDFTNPLASCKKQLEAERRLRDALARCETTTSDGNGDTGNDHEEEDSLDFTTDRFVREQIAKQMRHVTAPEVELTYGVERDGEITATIKQPSPADVTAYHDFHELQIAFDYIWEEAFDGTLPGLVKEAYAEMVRYANEVSGIPANAIEFINLPVNSVKDMRRLYEDMRLLQTLLEKEDENNSLAIPFPQNIKEIPLDINENDWKKIELSEAIELIRIAVEIPLLQKLDPFQAGKKREQAHSILATIRSRPDKEDSSQSIRFQPRASSRFNELMLEIDRRLGERYKFDIFAPNSTNYGIMLTYRQAWTPKNYQVGDLVSTIPLAPKEVRRYSKKRIVKKSRSQKELEDAQSTRSSESSSTARADAEIVKRATNKTSFETTAEGSLNLGAFEGRFGTKFGIDAEKASSSTKKNFREAVSKAAEEYKQQHRLEVETSTSEEFEFTDSGEISNPNDEITVTYLFYELQRQYQVQEQIHRLTPVVLVANEVPTPDQVDEDWLIAHHWILRRVILDDVYLPALDYVTTSVLGDEMALDIMWTNLQKQTNLVDKLVAQLEEKTGLATNAFEELKSLVGHLRDKNELDKLKDINVAAAFGPFAIAGLIGDNNEAAEKREEIAKLAIERADKDVQQASAKLSREVTALQEAIDKYTMALREHLDRQMAIAALRIHVKDNILCYMHAIWDHECGDQRYFRLYNIEVPWIEIEEHTTTLTGRRGSGFSDFVVGGENLIHLEGEIGLSYAKVTPKKLSEVADLDNLLGYKGNYMIFPVKEPNHLHWYMMQDYIDPATGGLRDPDEFANYTTDNLVDYACCLKQMEMDEFDDRIEQILELIKERAANPREESELIVVPTDSLYIEALPGKHPILEDFKLTHRAIDVKKVQAEVRHEELENVRLSARLLEKEREDPDIEKRIIFEGNAADIIVPPEA